MSFSRLLVEWMVFWSWIFPSRSISLALLMRGDDCGGWFDGINGFLECFCVVDCCHVFWFWFMVYAPGRSRVEGSVGGLVTDKTGFWREGDHGKGKGADD